MFEKAASPAFKVLRFLDNTIRRKGGFGSSKIARMATHLDIQTPHLIPPDNEPPYSQTPSTSNNEYLPQMQQHPGPSQSSDPYLVYDPPPIRPSDKPQGISSESTTITVDKPRKLLGYRNSESIIPHLKTCFQNNFHLSTIDREPALELGEVATIDKTKIATSPVRLPKNFGDVMHTDIGYGCSTSTNGVKYDLFVVDRATRYKFVYPIKRLQNDTLPTFQSLVREIGFALIKIMTDFDPKLMGAPIQAYFTHHGTKI